MNIPKHTHPKDLSWWMRIIPYILVTIILLLACFGVTSEYFMYVIGLYAGFRVFLWVRGGFQCLHCMIRAFFPLTAVGLLYFELPLQFLIAGIMVTWADYFFRFGHQFITEDVYEVSKLK